MLKIWGRTTSSNVQKLLWFCGEVDIPYSRVDAGLSFGVTKTPEYLAMNPNALVPTIEDNGFTLWESNTILRYLASKHQRSDWYPQDLQRRAETEKWMDWANSSLGAAITPLIWQLFRTPAEQRDHKLLQSSAEKSTAMINILEAHFAKQSAKHVYATGETLTLADIPMAIQAYRWSIMPWEQLNYQAQSGPHVQAWLDRLAERKVFRDVVMIGLS
jgi:glutathione S-transferase